VVKTPEVKPAKMLALTADFGAVYTKVQSGGQHLGIHDAMNYLPLLFCARCGRLSRSNEFIGGLCESCHYGKEVVDSPECLKAKQGDALEGSPRFPIAQKGDAHELPNAD
jgi:hypothetical protein